MAPLLAARKDKKRKAAEEPPKPSQQKDTDPTVKRHKKTKTTVPDPPEPESASESEDLHGFSTDEDSSDEDIDKEEPAVDVDKLPTIAKDDSVVQQKLEKARKKPAKSTGVLYLSRIPHGFYEDQLKAYFSQFGEVTRLRLSRNRKTGRSKHYGFLEFDSSSVAQIVAETMDNYLLMGHLLQCKVIPNDKVHPELWIGANRKWRTVPQRRVERSQQNKLRTEEEQERANKRLLKRQSQRKKRIQESGIKYDFDDIGYKGKVSSS